MVFGHGKNLFYGCFKDGGHLNIFYSNGEKTTYSTDIYVAQFCLVNFIPIKNKSNKKVDSQIFQL